jgi:hypothetical protein
MIIPRQAWGEAALAARQPRPEAPPGVTHFFAGEAKKKAWQAWRGEIREKRAINQRQKR